jgi:hypothetical protein
MAGEASRNQLICRKIAQTRRVIAACLYVQAAGSVAIFASFVTMGGAQVSTRHFVTYQTHFIADKFGFCLLLAGSETQ